jgi:hypothetical protein
MMVRFIDDHRQVHGVEPICRVCRSLRRPTFATNSSPGIPRGARCVRCLEGMPGTSSVRGHLSRADSAVFGRSAAIP